MSVEIKQDLTPEEKAKSYSKYFYRPPVDLPADILAELSKPADNSKALPLERISDLLKPGYLGIENGWCMLPNGGGFVANLVPMPGVTKDMFFWWLAWHSLEDLRFKIGLPGKHLSISLNEKDRAKVLDAKRPLAERFRKTMPFIVENPGGPSAQKTAIDYRGLDEFGIPEDSGLIAANTTTLMLNPPPEMNINHKMPGFMALCVRETSDGIEVRSRVWMGFHIANKILYYLLPKGVSIPEMAPAGMSRYKAHELMNLASFLPELYKEEKGAIA